LNVGLRPCFAGIVNPRRGNIYLPQLFLYVGNICLVIQSIGREVAHINSIYDSPTKSIPPVTICLLLGFRTKPPIFNISTDESVHQQVKYLNNVIEADHGKLKRLINPVRGFKSMKTAYATMKGFELMRMLKKGQLDFWKLGQGLTG
jgi:hypothetical protein